MGILKKFQFITMIIASLCMFARCADDQQGGMEEPVDEASSQGEAPTAVNASLNSGASGNAAANPAAGAQMNNAVEGGASNNFSGATNNTAITNNAALGASLNNVPLENPGTALTNVPLNAPTNLPLNAPLNATASQNAKPLNGTNSNAPASGLGNALAPPVNAAAAAPPVNTAQAPAPTNEDYLKRSGASPFQNPQMNWPGKGKVKYVTRRVTRHSAPNGPVVGEFDQGEHPLIFQNGNWVELNDGSYVKGNGLSDQGVGYPKVKPNWR